MTIDEFIAELRKSVDEFERHWRENNADMPDEYPYVMGAGDWDEQFVFFRSSE